MKLKHVGHKGGTEGNEISTLHSQCRLMDPGRQVICNNTGPLGKVIITLTD